MIDDEQKFENFGLKKKFDGKKKKKRKGIKKKNANYVQFSEFHFHIIKYLLCVFDVNENFDHQLILLSYTVRNHSLSNKNVVLFKKK